MAMPRFLSISVMMFACVLAACVVPGTKTETTQGGLRVMNLSANAGPVNVSVDGVTHASALAFQGTSSRQLYVGGAREIKITLPDNTTVLVDAKYLVTGTFNWMLFLYGSREFPYAMFLPDNPGAVDAGKFALRTAHNAMNSGPLDIYVTDVGADLNAATADFSGLTLGGATVFVQFAATQRQIRITPYAVKTIIYYDSGPITIPAASLATLAIHTTASRSLVNVEIVYTDPNSSAEGALVAANNRLSQLKMVNAWNNTDTLNLLVDGTQLLAAIDYKNLLTAPTYATTSAGTRALRAEASLAPGVAVASSPATAFASAADHTTVVWDNAGTVSLLALPDNNLLPATGQVKVRFVNVLSNGPSLDVQVNGVTYVTDVPIGTASIYSSPDNSGPSNYVSIVAGTYPVTFNQAGTSTSILAVPNLTFGANGVYTIYVIGTTGSPDYIMAQDL
jgi:hypothetical protein